MPHPQLPARFRFGIFEADATTGELRRKGVRIKLHSQPFQVLVLLLARPGEMLTREEISRELWPDGTFVDYEHGVHSAVNRLREALGDKAANPVFIETLARRGYRFVAPVERIGLPAELTPERDAERRAPEQRASAPAKPTLSLAEVSAAEPEPPPGFFDRVLATPEDLPQSPPKVVRTLFILLQIMYVGFYVGALANLAEIDDLLSALPFAGQAFALMVATAAMLIPARAFLISAVLFRAPRLRRQYLKIWVLLLAADILWSLAPFLLLHHIHYGLALACMTLLIYSPFAQRSLVLMGAGDAAAASR